MSNHPTVSVVIPVYNGAAFVGTAIRSVLQQTARPLEIIVVNDGSTDGTAQILDSFGDAIRRIDLSNSGVSTARNIGAHQARARMLAFLDADDAWLPKKLDRQLAAFGARPHVGLIYTGLVVVDRAGQEIRRMDSPAPEVALRNTLLLERPFMSIAQTSLIPTELFYESGGFDEHLSTSADLDLACRLAMAAPVAQVEEHLVLYRQHEGQMHRDPDLTERDCLHVFDKLFRHPSLPQSLAKSRRRAEANLCVSIAARYMQTDWRRALGYALRAGTLRPDRLFAAAGRLAMQFI